VRGAADDVLAAWCAQLGDDFLVQSRADAIAAGWFGPVVSPRIVERIGDVIAAPTSARAIIRSGVEPLQSRLIGHHGSLTAAEMLIPLYTAS
jgi:hypothetical protein